MLVASCTPTPFCEPAPAHAPSTVFTVMTEDAARVRGMDPGHVAATTTAFAGFRRRDPVAVVVPDAPEYLMDDARDTWIRACGAAIPPWYVQLTVVEVKGLVGRSLGLGLGFPRKLHGTHGISAASAPGSAASALRDGGMPVATEADWRELALARAAAGSVWCESVPEVAAAATPEPTATTAKSTMYAIPPGWHTARSFVEEELGLCVDDGKTTAGAAAKVALGFHANCLPGSEVLLEAARRVAGTATRTTVKTQTEIAGVMCGAFPSNFGGPLMDRVLGESSCQGSKPADPGLSPIPTLFVFV